MVSEQGGHVHMHTHTFKSTFLREPMTTVQNQH